MGNRVSIQLCQANAKSVVLFSHWGGMEFVDWAKQEIKVIQSQIPSCGYSNPMSRQEPQTVMVELARRAANRINELLIEGDLYFGFDEDDGDNSDNGHHIIQLPNYI